MVDTDSEINSRGEINSSLQSNQQSPKSQEILQSLGRQSSIYSLTLDEFQNSLCAQTSKPFGSMNMDEFLNSIWIAGENQAQAEAQGTTVTATSNNTVIPAQLTLQENNASTNHKGILLAQQPSVPRQGSLSIPEPLCRKTVDEVWSEIHGNNNQHTDNGNHGPIQNLSAPQKQPTFGEMTLEDFLVRAGVVREQNCPHAPPQQPPNGMYQNSEHLAVRPNFAVRPVMATCGGGVNNVVTYHGLQSGMKRGGEYPQPPPAVIYGGRLGNGNGGGYGGMGMGSPVSPGSSEGMGLNQVDNGYQYGLEMGRMRGGRKRNIDGTVEKVVERRQRRMIKNRESAARSRARKQAYTVELEAELNQLKEENEHLKQALAELEKERKRQYYEEEEARAKAPMQPESHKANEKVIDMGSSSCPQ